MKTLFRCILISIFCQQLAAQTPLVYYQFENSGNAVTGLGDDAIGGNYLRTASNCGYAFPSTGLMNVFTRQQHPASAANEFFMHRNPSTNNCGAVVSNSNAVRSDSILMIECMMRFDPLFWSANNLIRDPGRFSFNMTNTGIEIVVSLEEGANSVTRNLTINFGGFGRKDFCYYVDNQWHHFAFRVDARSSALGSDSAIQVFVDGFSPSGFSRDFDVTDGFGNDLPVSLGVGSNSISLGANQQILAAFDEVAIYDTLLSNGLIYEHYVDAILNHNHYSPTLQGLPVNPDTTFSLNMIDEDFPRGYSGNTLSAVEQLSLYPTPRYNPKNVDSLIRIFPWTNYNLVAGNDPAKAVSIQRELIDNFHYMLQITGRSTQGLADAMLQASIDLADNVYGSAVPRAYTIDWGHLDQRHLGKADSGAYIKNLTLDSVHYLQDGMGNFVPSIFGQTRVWSYAAPLDSIREDGKVMAHYLNNLDALMLTNGPSGSKIDYISENGEVGPGNGGLDSAGLMNDPRIFNDFHNNGFSSIAQYRAQRLHDFRRAYSDEFIMNSNVSGMQNAKFSWYAVSGEHGLTRYSILREIISPISGNRHATPFYYPQAQKRWYYGNWNFQSWSNIVKGRVNEIQSGDDLYAPFVSSGINDGMAYNVRDSLMMRPGPYLGMLKTLSVLGAEYFHNFIYLPSTRRTDTVFDTTFVGNVPVIDTLLPGVTNRHRPEWYVWQYVMPSYAQGVTSRFIDILKDGQVLHGDRHLFTNDPDPQYSFWSGPKSHTVVRKLNQVDRYVISSTVQPLSNYEEDSAPFQMDASIDLQSNGTLVWFESRRQGSTYIYDFSGTDTVFYQLDKWHQWEHPDRWSKDFYMESEVFDCIEPSASGSLFSIRTERSSSAISATDYRDFTSFLTVDTNDSSCWDMSNGPKATYFFVVRDSVEQDSLRLWVRARSKDGASTGFYTSLDTTINTYTGCIIDTNWHWYSMDELTDSSICYKGLALGTHQLDIYPSNASIELDQVVLSTVDTVFEDQDSIVKFMPMADFSADSVCIGDSTLFTNLSSNIALCHDFFWDFGDGVTSTSESRTHRYANPGVFDVTLVLTNDAHCSDTIVKTVVVSARPDADFIATGCLGDTMTFTDLSQSNIVSWSWDFAGLGNSILQHPSFYFLAQATYPVSLIVVDTNGCSDTSLQNVVLRPTPTATLSGTDTICLGDTACLDVQFTGVGPWAISYTIALDTLYDTLSSADTCISVVTDTSASYELIGVTTGNCHGTVSGVAFVEVVNLTAEISIDDTVFCSNVSQGYSLTGVPTGGVFSGPGVASIIANGVAHYSFYPSVAGAGAHAVVYDYTDPVTGCTASDTVVLVVHDPYIGVTGLASFYCIADPVASFSLSPAGGLISGNGISGNTFDPALAGKGQHLITYAVQNDSTRCISDTMFTITVWDSTAYITGLDSLYCDDYKDTLVGSFAPLGSFSGPNLIDLGNGTATLNGFISISGPQSYTYQHTFSNGCSSSITQTAVFGKSPTIDLSGFSYAHYCAKRPDTITAFYNLFSASGCNPQDYTFTWRIYDGSNVLIHTQSGNTPELYYTFPAKGDYRIELEIEDCNGCSSETASEDVNIKRCNSFSAYPNPAGANIQITASSANLDAVFVITDVQGNRKLSGSLTAKKTMVNTSGLLTGTYIITIRDISTGSEESITFEKVE